MPHIQIEHWFSWNCMFYYFTILAIWSVVALSLVCFLLRVAIRWLIMSIFLNLRLVRKSEREDLSWQRKCRYFRVGVWIVRFGIFGHICYKYKKYIYIVFISTYYTIWTFVTRHGFTVIGLWMTWTFSRYTMFTHLIVLGWKETPSSSYSLKSKPIKSHQLSIQYADNYARFRFRQWN